MARYDLKNYVKQVVAFDFQAIASDTTTAGNAINMTGYNSLVLVLACVARSAGDATLLIQDSDDDITYTDVSDTFLSGLEADTLVDAAQETTRIGYVGKKKHVKASVVTANGANLTVGAIALLSHTDVPIS